MNSIGLETEQYCFGCENFKPKHDMVIDYFEGGKEVNVNVHCKHLEMCRRIAKHIIPPGEKNEKTPGNR